MFGIGRCNGDFVTVFDRQVCLSGDYHIGIELFHNAAGRNGVLSFNRNPVSELFEEG
jgi:hypothetical protein